MPTYTDQLASLTAFTDSIINTNGVGAITGAVHNDNESAQNVSAFANLVAYDNYAYKVVRTYATDAANGQSLRDAYTDAITQTPGGNPLSATNRFALLIPPGTYALGGSGLDVNTEFVDLIGLGKPEETIITSVSNTATGLGTIIQTADDVRYKNIQIQNTAITYVVGDDTDDSGYAPQGTFANTVMEDVIFLNPEDLVNLLGAPFMRPLQSYAGTYVRCKGIDTNGVSVMFGGAQGKFVDCETESVSGFGLNLPASGTFINCSALSGFGQNGDATGTFTRCRTFGASFGSGTGLTVSGTFTDCISGSQSFGYGSTATGRFYNCRSGAFSFGSSSSAAVYENCVAGQQSFSFLTGATLAGTYNNCTAGNQSFGGAANSTLSGKFNNCTAGDQSFCGFTNSVLSGTFNNCNAGVSSFGVSTLVGGGGVILNGAFNHCTAGSNSFGNGDSLQLSGTFNFCEAGDSSFGSIIPFAPSTGPSMSGTFNSCVAGFRSFGSSFTSNAIVDVSGKFYNCTAGERSFGYICRFLDGAEFHGCVSNGVQSFRSWAPEGPMYGLFQNCTGKDGSFQIISRPEAKFVNCTGGNSSFSVGTVEFAGTYINCTAGVESFGYVPLGPAETVTLSGIWENCTAGDRSFGSATGDQTQVLCSGTFINCSAGDDSFASNGPSGGGSPSSPAGADAAGYFENCRAGFRSFGGTPIGKKSGRFVRCTLVDRDGTIGVASDLGPLVDGGIMQDCTWVMRTLSSYALKVETGAKVFGGIYKAGASATASITSTGAATVSIANVLTNVALGGSITNNITAPNVIIDADI
jgi:hypothetical protein